MSSRVSTKIQQLLNTLKRPKRPPLKEFFVDDFEEIVEGNSTKKWFVLIICYKYTDTHSAEFIYAIVFKVDSDSLFAASSSLHE